MWPSKVQLVMAVVRPILWVIGPVVTVDKYPILQDGGMIVVAPHRSMWDVFIIQLVIDRQILFMAKRPFFTWPIIGWLIRYLDAFPVSQNMPDREAIKTAVSHLQQGRVVGIFPEGKIRQVSDVSEILPGVALIAARSNAPVLTLSITGSSRPWYLRRRITVRFNPLLPAPKTKSDQAELLEKIRAFLNEA